MITNRSTSVASALTLCAVALLGGCDGSSGSATGDQSSSGTGPRLLRTEFGRLVDVYSYRRIDPQDSDRRNTRNRTPTLVQREVVVSSSIQSEPLFDAIGGERTNANYRFLPFDPAVGHDELLIMWDDRDPIEGARFESAFDQATRNLAEIPPSYRDQNTTLRPIPVVPRNAAIKLTFSADLGVDSAYFDANPGAVQTLQFLDDPNAVTPQAAFLPANVRILASGSELVVDTTLIGGEAFGRATSTGLRPSLDQSTANFRIAIPTSGFNARLNVQRDAVPELNDVDSNGVTSVIRDFRSGNASDGLVGALTDSTPPTIVGDFPVGITAVDVVSGVMTLNKRGNLVAVRGRIPFVDGALMAATGLPGGPNSVPTIDATQNRSPLASGDFISQTVVSPTGERVTLRAEIIENLDVGREFGDARYPAPGLTPNGDDGGDLPVTTIRVDSIRGVDSQGNEVTFVADSVNPLGADASLRTNYYEYLQYANEFGIAAAVSDSERRFRFLRIDPPPTPPTGSSNTSVTVRWASPFTSMGLRFSKPMDIARIDTLDNYVYTTVDVPVDIALEVLETPKSASLSVLPSRIVDQTNDGTGLSLLAPLGHFHEQGERELYWFHALLDDVRDLSGNKLDIYDRRPPGQVDVSYRRSGSVVTTQIDVPLQNFSVQFEMLDDAQSNLVGTRVLRFAAGDEDGSVSGSIDLFGQFRLADGKLTAAPTTRFSANCDATSLSGVERFAKGECVDGGAIQQPINPLYNGGFVYQTPSNVVTRTMLFPTVFRPPEPPVNFGGIAEPHVRRGSRMQLTYREDDFGLDQHEVGQLNIDVEQLHWAPWNDQPAYFDTFDKYSLLLGHSDKRPDLLFFWNAALGECDLDCASLFSSLSTTFSQNVLRTSTMTRVVDKARYVVQPARAFRTNNVKYVPYPEFERTFTWRDSRIVSWDTRLDQATGLGGAVDAATVPPAGNRTASVSSPWNPEDPENSVDGDSSGPAFNRFVRDQGDFLGDRTRDHDPIALPLLVEFRVSPDDTVAAATSGNLFHIGYIGPPYSDTAGVAPGGYYSAGFAFSTPGDGTAVRAQCSNIIPPFYRVHSTGGIDPVTNTETLIQPDDQATAIGGLITDIGLGALPHTGLFRTPFPGDDHIYWGQIDFVRRVSLVTGGFFDTAKPNQHALAVSGLPGLPPGAGRPDFSGESLGVGDFVVVLDPPSQPGGTKLTVELRGVRQIGPEGVEPALYDPINDDNPLTRGNLLNPNYACDAYRYAMATPAAQGATTPRVQATGFTPYVPPDRLDSIRDSRTGALPRYMNFRLVMENNIAATPAVSPSLDGMAFVYRMIPTSQ